MLTADAEHAGRTPRRLRLPGRVRRRVARTSRDLRSDVRAVAVRARLRGTAAALVSRTGDRAVVVLADPARRDAVRRWRRDFPHDHVTVLVVGGPPDRRPDSEWKGKRVVSVEVGDLEDVVAHLTRLNAQDVIVVVLGSTLVDSLAGDLGGLFEHLFLHLRQGGAYVVDRTVERAGTKTRARPTTEGAEDRLFQILAAGRDHDRRAGLRPLALALARQVDCVLVTKDLVVATKVGRNRLKLRESQIEDLLPERERGIEVSVLETRPSGRLVAAVGERSYGPVPAVRWPAALEYPEMTLRHYEGHLVSLGSMRLYSGDTILPESYRWPFERSPSHPKIASLTPTFGRLDRRTPPVVLDGDFYFLDCVFPGYFGHLTTEVLCRLWGWERAKREIPRLRVLFHTNPAGPRRADGSLERRLFTAYGISQSDLTWSDRPVQVRSVVGASPMWHNHRPYYAHPDLRETWARMTAGLLDDAGDVGGAPYARIFVSRGAALSHRRRCRNQGEVESFFASRGYHVIYPEELPLASQVQLFAGARVVAGFGGSAMTNLMHCQRLEALVVISHHAYAARNEHLFASLLGAQLHYFWQTPDVEGPRGKRSKESARSPFAFDFAASGEELDRLLASL